MKAQLESLPKLVFDWFLAELDKAPFCQVESSGKRSFKLPKDAGIYVVYLQEEDTPVYAGEASSLRRRVLFHFSEFESAKKNSTLKKKLKEKGYGVDAPTHELVRFKHVVIPFGRKEIETLFH